MTEQAFARRMLTVPETIRDVPKVREDDVSDEFIEGYEQALDDVSEWLKEEFRL
jgi:hypothetical protein